MITCNVQIGAGASLWRTVGAQLSCCAESGAPWGCVCDLIYDPRCAIADPPDERHLLFHQWFGTDLARFCLLSRVDNHRFPIMLLPKMRSEEGRLQTGTIVQNFAGVSQVCIFASCKYRAEVGESREGS